MRNRVSAIIFVMIVALFSISVNAQLPQKFREMKQRKDEIAKNELNRYNSVVNTGNLGEYELYIKDYPNGKYTPEIKKQAREVRLWEQAKSKNTIVAYEKYLKESEYNWYKEAAEREINWLKQEADQVAWNKAKATNTIEGYNKYLEEPLLHTYEKQAKREITNLKQKAEQVAWNKVKNTGTLQAYEEYLKNNPNSGYRSEAEKMVNQIKGAEAWKEVKNTNSIYDLERFISQYPNALELTEAKNRLCELKGINYYEKGQLSSAYSELSKLSRYQLSEKGKIAYDAATEYKEFAALGSYSDESELKSFINKYPNGAYVNEVSNMIAMSKARSFGYYASTNDYNLALSYAKDETTRETVQNYISSNKNAQKEREKRIKAAEREENGGLFNLGWNIADFGFGNECGYWNTGLVLRLGNYADRVQFAVGLNLGLYFSSDYSDYEYYYDYGYGYDYDDEGETSLQIPLFGQLKVNLFEVSENSRFYLMGEYHYNLVGNSMKEEGYPYWNSAWGTGIGIAWKHFDMSIYMRKNIGVDGTFGGMSFIYYWQL